MTTTTTPSRYATAAQAAKVASSYVAFASWLLDVGTLAPVYPAEHRVYCQVPDKQALEAFAASLGLPVTPLPGQWRAEKTFGPLTYVLWCEAAGDTGGAP